LYFLRLTRLSQLAAVFDYFRRFLALQPLILQHRLFKTACGADLAYCGMEFGGHYMESS
jgi:hypothetical protein